MLDFEKYEENAKACIAERLAIFNSFKAAPIQADYSERNVIETVK